MDATSVLLWLLALGLVVVGLMGTVLPAVPGVVLVLAGFVVGAWVDGFVRVGPWAVVAAILLTVLAWVLEYAAGLLGARRAGGSRWAMVGAAVGTVAGIFLGLWGVLVLPLVGAALGEYLSQRDQMRAVKVGVATWVGMMLGLVAKVVVAFALIGLFVVAWWW